MFYLQGAIALCRVVKKNDQGHKTSDSHGEPKTKNICSSSNNGGFTSAVISNEHMSASGDISQITHLHNECHHSSPIASPYQLTAVAEFETLPMENNPSSLWVSPDLILDSSKVIKSRENIDHGLIVSFGDFLIIFCLFICRITHKYKKLQVDTFHSMSIQAQ